jgi:SagB-type dehydrogenase family enzyme
MVFFLLILFLRGFVIKFPSFLEATELHPANYPEMRDRILGYSSNPFFSPRSYPGYPQWELPRVSRLSLWSPSLEKILKQRRTSRKLQDKMLTARSLSRILWFSHHAFLPEFQGPTPSAGGLQALELYLAVWAEPSWLPRGLYHYNRKDHLLAQIAPTTRSSKDWLQEVPSLEHLEGGAFLWILVGDSARTFAKYQERGERFLLLEAGHLMQNLCLMSERFRTVSIPLGGFFEGLLATHFQLLPQDKVLYVACCGLKVS